MAYTFGAATSNVIQWTDTATNFGITGRGALVAGWFYPTQLTAGLALWSVGTNHRAVIAATTSEIDLFLDRTTDTQWRTSGLGFAINTWHFIAVMVNNFNTGVVTNYKVWRSTGADMPQAVTVSQVVAGTGNVASSTAVNIGNIGTTLTSSFVGDIGRFDYFAPTANGFFPDNTNGSIGPAAEEAAYRQVVLPIWAGNFPTLLNSGTNTNNGVTHVVVDLDDAPAYGRRVRNGATIITQGQAVTVSGATVSANRAPIKTFRPVEWPDLLRR